MPSEAITVRMASAPFSGDPPQSSIYYELLGRFIVLWGRFELNFDLAIFTLYMLPEAKPMIVGMPGSWRDRSRIWRKLLSSIDRLEPLRNAALRLITDARKTSEFRNRVYHSGFQKFRPGDPITLEFAEVHITSQSVTRTHPVSMSDLSAYCTQADNLNTRLAQITIYLTDLFPPPRLGSTNVSADHDK